MVIPRTSLTDRGRTVLGWVNVSGESFIVKIVISTNNRQSVLLVRISRDKAENWGVGFDFLTKSWIFAVSDGGHKGLLISLSIRKVLHAIFCVECTYFSWC